MDLHPEIISGHMSLAEAVSRVDQHETRTHRERGVALYVASTEADQPYIPAGPRAEIAGAVLLLIYAIGLEMPR
jgi:hypothetical protein